MESNEYQTLFLEEQAKVFKAMAHPSRLLIINAVAEEPLCVCELRDLVGHDISTVSKHLSILKDAGILESEKRGKQIFYSLSMKCVIIFSGCIRSTLEERAKEQLEVLSS